MDWMPAPVSVPAQLLVASVLIVAGLAKLTLRQRLRESVDAYQLLPQALVPPAAAVLVLPAAELLLGVCLGLGIATSFCALVAAGMLAAFVALQVSAFARGLSVNCSCFGILYREPIGLKTIGRDSLLLICSLAVAVGSSESLVVSHSDLLRVETIGALVCLGAAGMVGISAMLRPMLSD